MVERKLPSVLTRYCCFPYRSVLSYAIAPFKVYPAFMRDVREGLVDFKVLKIDAGCVELYTEKGIEFHMPTGENRPHYRLTEAERPAARTESDDEDEEEQEQVEA